MAVRVATTFVPSGLTDDGRANREGNTMKHQNIGYWATIAIIPLSVAASCQDDHRTQLVPARLAVVAPANPSALTLHRIVAKDSIGVLASQLASELYGETAPAEVFKDAFGQASVVPGSTHVASAWKPSLKMSYFDDNNDLVLVNETVTEDSLSPNDVGPAAAEAIFQSTLQSLVARGAIAAGDYNSAKVKTSQIMQGDGVSGQPLSVRVKEYMYRISRVAHGIEVFNSGVLVSVHRSGKLARLRVFGPVVSAALGPGGSGLVTTPTISQDAADARAARDYPKAKTSSLGLQYWLPQGIQSAVAVEPRYMYRVVPILPAVSEGKNLEGQAFFVGYSTHDSTETPLVLPKPAVGVTADRK